MRRERRRARTGRVVTIAGTVIFASFAMSMAAEGAAGTPAEQRVKSAFLYQLVRFVEWPAGAAEQPLVLCLHGPDPFGSALDATVRERRVHDRELRIERTSDAGALERCDVVFFGAGFDEDVALIATLEGRAVLTLADRPDFVERGGVVSFVPRGDRVGFRVNVDAARRQRLRISAYLLNLADVVEDPEVDRAER